MCSDTYKKRLNVFMVLTAPEIQLGEDTTILKIKKKKLISHSLCIQLKGRDHRFNKNSQEGKQS